ncbi:neutral zinc metallopeptidase [Mycobacterium sp. DL99]|uniref:neutral zinc metallopeptidase n=1 Tax=Mycobacterium sp. DL99 TaxID=2528957 RepID=UPI001081F665|nr:neutral zinc metallopeptidase [Mycobacterium sp. DL99]
MQSWGPFGPPPKSWGDDPFAAGADPFAQAKSDNAKPADPWASAPDPWATAPSGSPVPPQHQPGDADPWGGQSPAYPAPLPTPKSPRRPAILIGSAVAVVVVLALIAAGVAVFKQQGSTSASEPASPAGAVPTSELTSTPSYTATTTPPPTTTSAMPLPTGEAALGQNRIYANFDAGLTKQPCNPVGWPSDAVAAEIFYQAALQCLEAAWKPVVTAAGFEFRNVTLSVPTGDVMTTPCGTYSTSPGQNPARYCSGQLPQGTLSETIYMPLAGMPADRYGDKAIIYLSMLAHEYGHHIQSLLGTGGEESRQKDAVGEQSEQGLELTRRYELQAQCFSGMFIGSIVDTGGRFTVADYQIALDDNATRGDWNPSAPRDHGSKAHFSGWWDQGYRENKIGQCNTWLSPSSDVS